MVTREQGTDETGRPPVFLCPSRPLVLGLCALALGFTLVPILRPAGRQSDAIPTGTSPGTQIPSGGELHGAGPTLFPALLDLSASTQGGPVAGLPASVREHHPF